MSKLYKLLFILCSFFSFYIIVLAEDFDITSKALIIYNLNDDSILYEKNKDEKLEIASLTKIMTTIVAIENIDDLSQNVLVKSEYLKGLEEYATVGLSVGDTVSYQDLLYGIMLPSGADAVNSLILSYTTMEDYITLMNNEAKKLKMTNTHFDNAIGEDSSENYSTAYDLAILLKYALKNETFKKIFTTMSYDIEPINKTVNSTLKKYSKTLDNDISSIKGAKSGFTDGAGLCLASYSTYNDVDYLLIDLGSTVNTSKSNAVKDSITVYKYFYDNYSYQTIIKKNSKLAKVKVKNGNIKEYIITSNKTIQKYLKNDIDLNNIKYEYTGIDELTYKNKKGDLIGKVSITYNGEVLDSLNVYIDKDIKYYHPLLYLIILIVLVLFIIIKLKKKKRKKRKRKHKR